MPQLETINHLSPVFNGIEICAFPITAGPLRAFGRDLKIAFPQFMATFTHHPSTKERKLSSAVVNLSKVVCVGAVDGERNLIGPLTGGDTPVVERRVTDEILDVHRFPIATFRPLHEEELFLRGLLELHGEQHEITCLKSVTADNLFIKCPLDTRDYKIPQHASFLGAIKVDFKFDVMVKIPLSTLQTQGKTKGDAMPMMF